MRHTRVHFRKVRLRNVFGVARPGTYYFVTIHIEGGVTLLARSLYLRYADYIHAEHKRLRTRRQSVVRNGEFLFRHTRERKSAACELAYLLPELLAWQRNNFFSM